MFTDMVGFTAMGQTNESLSLALVDEQRRLIRPVLARHDGREVKTIGDAFLVEFASALDAVNCAVEIQSALKEANRSAAPERRITLRIGIHLGDVVHQGADVAGDAVNVASRIEPLSPPGGVCVSAQVYHSVVNKVEQRFESLGVPELKNVVTPIEVFRISGLGEAPERPAQRTPRPKERVAVLPLDNFSPDPNDEYFADGVTEELIDRLSQVRDLRVIARTSVMGYKRKEKKVSEIARELGVGTIVEGSVRKAGSRIRITVQLIDAATEEHLWSDRYDRELDDVFAVQTEIASRIAAALATQLASPSVRASAETTDIEAYTSFLRGRKLLSEKGSEESIRQALAFFEESVRRDPSFAKARVGVAECLVWLGSEGAIPYVDSVTRARGELTKALELDDALAEAHSVLAGLMIGQDDVSGCEREARRAMELNPSLADPYRWLGQVAAGDGKIRETVRLLEAAQQVDPLDTNVTAFLGRAYMYAGMEAEALAHWERTKPLIPFRTNAHMTEYHLGRADYAKAGETLREMERLRPNSVWTEMYRGVLAARLGDAGGARGSIRAAREASRRRRADDHPLRLRPLRPGGG